MGQDPPTAAGALLPSSGQTRDFRCPGLGTPISLTICACHRPSPVCKTPLGASSYYQLDPMKDTHPITQANSGCPMGLQGAGDTSPPQAPLGPQTSLASGSAHRC